MNPLGEVHREAPASSGAWASGSLKAWKVACCTMQGGGAGDRAGGQSTSCEVLDAGKEGGREGEKNSKEGREGRSGRGWPQARLFGFWTPDFGGGLSSMCAFHVSSWFGAVWAVWAGGRVWRQSAHGRRPGWPWLNSEMLWWGVPGLRQRGAACRCGHAGMGQREVACGCEHACMGQRRVACGCGNAGMGREGLHAGVEQNGAGACRHGKGR
eukprot:191667-Chlamydomonas_euryale.AAC.1